MLTLINTDNSRVLPRSYTSPAKTLDINSNEVDLNCSNQIIVRSKGRSSLRTIFSSIRAKRIVRRQASLLENRNEFRSLASSSTSSSLKTISSDTPLRDRVDSPDEFGSMEIKSPGSVSSTSSADKKTEFPPTPSRSHMKKKKYFSERNNPNIFKKLLHPNYQERSLQFRKLFGTVVEDHDRFLTSFSCAYQREILCQGRMFISQLHVCFYANIFSWETCFAIPIRTIVSITKERAALIFPNSIQIETEAGEKFFFASFVNREKSLTVLSLVHEKVKNQISFSPEELYEMMNPADDKKEESKRMKSKSNDSPLSPSTPALSRPDTEFPAIQEASSHSSLEQIKQILQLEESVENENKIDMNEYEDEEEEEVVCPCESHNGKLLMDSVYSLSPNELHRILFTETPWIQKFNESLRNSGYIASDWALDKDGVRQRTCTYTMALNQAMAPKSCIVTEKQVINFFGKQGDGFVVNKETQNAGVPYSDHFTVQCSYCVTRVSSNECRLKVHGGIHYKKSVWSVVKGYIEKGTYQGLDEHYSALEQTLNEECERRRQAAGTEEMENIRIESDSISSSQEDRSSEQLTRTVATTSRSKTRTETSRVSNISTIERHTVPHHHQDQQDYSFYIRVIIGLLAGLVLLNLLLFIRMGSLEHRAAISEVKPADSAVLENLITTVGQLTKELEKMKQKMHPEL